MAEYQNIFVVVILILSIDTWIRKLYSFLKDKPFLQFILALMLHHLLFFSHFSFSPQLLIIH